MIVCKYSKLYCISTHDEGVFCIKAVPILLLGSLVVPFFIIMEMDLKLPVPS